MSEASPWKVTNRGPNVVIESKTARLLCTPTGIVLRGRVPAQESAALIEAAMATVALAQGRDPAVDLIGRRLGAE